MMVLKRKIGQAFHLGGNIKITVVDVQNGRHVRFGIEAPVEIPVHRMEIYELIQNENKAASDGNALAWFSGNINKETNNE